MKRILGLAAVSMVSTLAGTAFAANCPDISGVYFLNSNEISKVGSVSSEALSPGACQYEGDGSNPALLGETFVNMQNVSESSFPKGIRIYVYPASADYCQYISLVSELRAGQLPYLDSHSYEEVQALLPPNLQAAISGQYNGDMDSYNKNQALLDLGLAEGSLSLSNAQYNADGSIDVQLPGFTDQPSSDNGTLGLHVRSTYQESVLIRPDKSILTSALSHTYGVRFDVIPVDSTDATSCLLQKSQ